MFELPYDPQVKLGEEVLWHFLALQSTLHPYFLALPLHDFSNAHLPSVTHYQQLLLALSQQLRGVHEEVIYIFKQVLAGYRHIVLGDGGTADTIIELRKQDDLETSTLLKSQVNIIVAHSPTRIPIHSFLLHIIKE